VHLYVTSKDIITGFGVQFFILITPYIIFPRDLTSADCDGMKNELAINLWVTTMKKVTDTLF